MTETQQDEQVQGQELALSSESWFHRLTSWTRSSLSTLEAVEKKILSFLNTEYKGRFVEIEAINGKDRIWTIVLNQQSKEIPIVLLHGMGAGVAIWVKNLDALAKNRPVYAIDVLGFGRSTRPDFSKNPLEVEKQLVKSVEEWRKRMKLEKFILLGHSMGGFIAASYVLQHPDNVKHLILADPWGFPDRPDGALKKLGLPLWIRAITFVLQPLNPLWGIRFAGPFGQLAIENVRPDIIRKFAPVLKDDVRLIAQYIHQCNSQKPSGENAFSTMKNGFAWAKIPMARRIYELKSDIPITFVNGKKSWVDSSASEGIKQNRPSSYVNIEIIDEAGHHVFLDKSETFDEIIEKACAMVHDRPESLNEVNALKETEIAHTEDMVLA